MKVSQSIRIISLLAVLFGFTVSTASANMYQEQSQSSSNSFKFSSNCEGSDCGEVTFKSKSKLNQSQSQGTGSYRDNWGYKTNDHWNRKNAVPRYGNVTISWDHRGGTCYVRYSESNVSSYKYSTNSACDNDQVVVGGLRRGSTYRFQVKKDDGDWSAPMWLRAN